MPSGYASENQLIIINKSNNNLIFYENDKAVELFKVATGRSQSLTPEGEFKIINMVKNRPYYKEGIPGGDPSNPLGDRWFGLDANGTYGNTYGIHGNNSPYSIGTYASAGCVRMYNEQVRWLFDKVEMNTPVLIVSSNQSFDAIGEEYGYTVTGADEEAVAIGSSSHLSQGNIGSSVKKLQSQLTSLGYHSDDKNGKYGEGTEKSVKRFQENNQLDIDGIVGPATKSALENRDVWVEAPLYIPSNESIRNRGYRYVVTRSSGNPSVIWRWIEPTY